MENNDRGNDGFRTSNDIFQGYDTTYTDMYAQQEKEAIENGEIPEQPPEPEPRKKKKRRKKHYMLRLLAVVALAAGTYAFLMSPVFSISKIAVEDNSIISSEDIVAASGVKTGDNLFAVKTRKVKKAIQKNAYIKSVSLRRDLPDRLVISVTERVPAACIMKDGKYLVMDSDGEIMDEADSTMSSTLIEGISVVSWEKSSAPEVSDEANFKAVLDLIDQVDAEGMFFRKVSVGTEGSVNAYVTDTLICKGTPEHILSSMDGIKAILYDLDQKGIKRGVIEIDGSNYASFSPVLDS